MTREEWKQFEDIRWERNVVLAMRARCEEQGHEYEPGISLLYQRSDICKWCGDRK